MNVLKTAVCTGLILAFCATGASAQSQPSPSISEQAAAALKKKQRRQELERNDVKTGQKIDRLGDLSIEQFLMLKPVPEGLDVVSSANMADEAEVYKSLPADHAAAAVSIMRSQGIEMPKDLEKNIRKNPDKAADMMKNAMKKVKPSDVKTPQDVAKYRRDLIRKAEEMTGVDFRYLLKAQKQLMLTEDFQ